MELGLLLQPFVDRAQPDAALLGLRPAAAEQIRAAARAERLRTAFVRLVRRQELAALSDLDRLAPGAPVGGSDPARDPLARRAVAERCDRERLTDLEADAAAPAAAPASRSSADEHPAMALEVLGAVAEAVGTPSTGESMSRARRLGALAQSGSHRRRRRAGRRRPRGRSTSGRPPHIPRGGASARRSRASGSRRRSRRPPPTRSSAWVTRPSSSCTARLRSPRSRTLASASRSPPPRPRRPPSGRRSGP